MPRTTFVVDSNIALLAATAGGWGFRRAYDWIAPPLLWSEVRSSLHEALWRREISPAAADAAREAFATLGIQRVDPPGLDALSWQLADELGWAKTYDAEFLALASLADCRLVTADARLHRGAARTGLVVGPAEL